MCDFFGTFRSIKCVLPLALWILTSCSVDDSGGQDKGFPAAGELKLISVERLTDSSNVFLEGDFEQWYAGAPRPSGGFAVPDRNSKVTRAHGAPSSGTWFLSQTWQTADSRWDFDSRLTLELDDLKPYSTYAITLNARVPSGSSVDIDVIGYTEDGEPFPIALPLIRVEPSDNWQPYSAEFYTGYNSYVDVKTSCYAIEPGAEQVLHLDDVAVRLVSSTSPATPTLGADGNMVLNGSFENWVPSHPIPEGQYNQPSITLKHSTVDRWLRRASDGSASIHQVWVADDSDDPPMELFGFTVKGLRTNTTYSLQFSLERIDNSPAAVSLYGLSSEGAPMCVACPIFTTTGDEKWWQEHSVEFNTGEYSDFLVATHVPKGTSSYPSRVLWDNFRVKATDLANPAASVTSSSQ